MQQFSASPKELVGSIIRNRELIKTSVKREVVGRYRGSYLGILWSFANPLFMLAVYTFVFSVVFKMRWGGDPDASRSQFAIILFVGMIVHSMFSETINKAPLLILGNINFVKKIIYPLEILPVVAVGAAIFHMLVSTTVLLTAILLVMGDLQWTIVFTPIIFLPLIILTTGFSWILSSLGVFLRDVNQFIGIITSVLLFLAPVFYPLSAIPEAHRIWIMLNPLTFIIEQTRDVLIWGVLPNWKGLGIYTVISCIVAFIGFFWFQKTRKGFADVL